MSGWSNLTCEIRNRIMTTLNFLKWIFSSSAQCYTELKCLRFIYPHPCSQANNACLIENQKATTCVWVQQAACVCLSKQHRTLKHNIGAIQKFFFFLKRNRCFKKHHLKISVLSQPIPWRLYLGMDPNRTKPRPPDTGGGLPNAPPLTPYPLPSLCSSY